MFDKNSQIETLSIVLIGDFNPVIFQPAWLANKKLIREDEAEKAKIEVIHPAVNKFEISDWLKVEITRERFELRTSKVPYFLPLRDIIIGSFKILRETPIRSFGINYIHDISLPNEKSYFDFGNFLAPLSIWENCINNPKLLQVEIFEKERRDGNLGNRRVRITPSDQKISYGITFNINSHFDLKNNSENIEMVNLLSKFWEVTYDDSKKIVENILSQTNLLYESYHK